MVRIMGIVVLIELPFLVFDRIMSFHVEAHPFNFQGDDSTCTLPWYVFYISVRKNKPKETNGTKKNHSSTKDARNLTTHTYLAAKLKAKGTKQSSFNKQHIGFEILPFLF
jgi:hypothetical protein